MSFRVRITVLLAGITLAFFAAAGFLIVEDMRRSIREEIEATTKITVQLITTAAYTSQLLPGGGGALGNLREFLDRLGRVRANDIVLADRNGRELHRSPPSLYKAGRSAPEWFEALMFPKVDRVVIRIPGGLLTVTPEPSRATLDAWDDLTRLAGVGAFFFLALNALLFWFVGRSLQPLRTVLDGLAAMERGRLDTRLPAMELPEFAAIGQTFNRMAEALHASTAESDRLARILRQSGDPIVVRDLAGRVSFWNPAAERLFGWTAAEMAGQGIDPLLPAERAGEPERTLAAVQAGAGAELETERLTRDGGRVAVLLRAAPLTDPDTGQVAGEIASYRDLTEKRRADAAALALAENRALTHVIQAHVEEERRRLARELHDELGQCVTGIKTIAMSIANRTAPAEPVHASARAIVDVASRLYDATHGIIRELRPSALDQQGLAEALSDAVGDFRTRHPELAVELRLEGALDGLSDEVSTCVYRTVQEALTNVARHAQASRVDVGVANEGAAIRVRVKDDGQGMEPGAGREGQRYGMLGIRERVESLGGELRVDTAPGAGLAIQTILPLRTDLRLENHE